MNLISTFIVWTWLLGIALVVPTTLPAGGAQKSNIQQRKNNISSPIIALYEFNLLSSASENSSILTRVKAGTPVNVMKVWESNDGQFIDRLTKFLGKVDKDQRWVAYNLIAEQARAVGLEGEAKRILDEADSACKPTDFRNRDKLGIWQCVSCKSLHEDWQAFCPACDEFSVLSWQRPSGVTPMIHSP